WSQLAMWAAPRGLAADRHLEARRLREGTLVRLETVADGAGPFVLRVPEVGEVVLRPTGRRAFVGVVPPLEAGVHPAVLAAGGHEEPVEIIVPARSASPTFVGTVISRREPGPVRNASSTIVSAV